MVMACMLPCAGLDHLSAGTRVNVTYLVGADMDDSVGETCTDTQPDDDTVTDYSQVSTCARLAKANLSPVAHVPARAFADMVRMMLA